MPQAVLHAIALTETGRPDGGRLRPYPWAINREGKGHWFASREEALALLACTRRKAVLPEPLRIAHLVARAVATGESRGRA